MRKSALCDGDIYYLQSNYDEEETRFVVNGFVNGFPIGYNGPTNRQQTARNLPLTYDTTEDVWCKIMKEVKLGRVAGPYENIPFDNYIQSPVGLVLKQNNDTRLIFHLLRPRNSSLNYYTPKGLCTVKYRDLEDAVRLCLASGKGSCMAKSDMKSAFRNLPIRPQDWRWLVMMATHPISKKKLYFYDKNSQFGASISCSHFQRVSNAIEWIIRHRTGRRSINYLDDFFLITLEKLVFDWLVNQLVCQY